MTRPFQLNGTAVLAGKSFLHPLVRARIPLILTPNHDPVDPGWYWLPAANLQRVPLTAGMARCKARRVQLVSQGYVLEIAEHLLALRHLLAGVTVHGYGWGAYAGSAGKLWSQIRPVCRIYPEGSLPCYTIAKPVRHTYASFRGGDRPAFTEIAPSDSGDLEITVTCCYSGLGKQTRSFCFDTTQDDSCLSGVYAATTQGWPKRNYHLSRAGRMIGWPHHSEITWPQEHPDALDIFLRHRAQDILGALGLLCGKGRLSLKVTSYCSGHVADVEVVRTALPLLRPLA